MDGEPPKSSEAASGGRAAGSSGGGGAAVARAYSHRTKSSNACGSSSGSVRRSSKASLKPELKAERKKSDADERRFSCRRQVTAVGPTRIVTMRSEKRLALNVSKAVRAIVVRDHSQTLRRGQTAWWW